MKLNRQESLGKTVEATATNRPIKIAYLVPFDDAPQTHVIIDAVFFESYTRWAGAYTLVIPTEAEKFLADGYEDWLKHFDPDFIYSYVSLDASLVEKIDAVGCPIALIKHEVRSRQDNEISWRSFIPDWGHYIHPVSSISTVQSPSSFSRFRYDEEHREPTIFTQYGSEPTSRFLADNFGVGFSLHTVTHAIPGLFKTLCLVAEDLPDKIVAGTERCFSILDAFQFISDRKAIPIARLAMMNSSGVLRPESMEWTSAFRIFVGDTPLDRIHFWNSRHIGSSWSDASNALIVAPEFFDDERLVKQLGEYLNRNNFLGNSNGPYKAELHTSSVEIEALNIIREKLTPPHMECGACQSHLQRHGNSGRKRPGA